MYTSIFRAVYNSTARHILRVSDLLFQKNLLTGDLHPTHFIIVGCREVLISSSFLRDGIIMITFGITALIITKWGQRFLHVCMDS